MVPGAGATEVELAKQISSYGEVSFSLSFLQNIYINTIQFLQIFKYIQLCTYSKLGEDFYPTIWFLLHVQVYKLIQDKITLKRHTCTSIFSIWQYKFLL